VDPRLALPAVVAGAFLAASASAGAQIVRDTTRRPIPAAEVTPPPETDRRRVDSTRVDPDKLSPAERAEYEQNAFEAYRHTHLPYASNPRPQNCDERVGRFCYWYEENVVIPKEVESVTRARETMLAMFDSLARLEPNSVWIAEVRVRYLSEIERYDDALKVARECGGTAPRSWPCEILEGFSLHLAERYEEAGKVYDAALAHMSPKERCEWTNIQYLLDEVALGQFRDLACDDPKRSTWFERTMFLARTLYSMKGNDSRTEYFARMTMARMFTHARSPHQFDFDTDERELLLRFGWPRWWSGTVSFPLMLALTESKGNENSGTGGGTPGPINPGGAKGRGRGGTPVGSYPPGTKIPKSVPPLERPPDLPGTRGIPQGAGGGPADGRPSFPRLPMPSIQQRPGDLINVYGIEPFPSYRYIPAGFVLNNPTVADSADWRPQLPPVMGRYAPPYAKKLVELEHQKAVFKRGDSALVVLSYDTKGTREVEGSPLRAAIAVTPVGDRPRDFVAARDNASVAGVLTVRAPWGPLLMSAELTAPAKKAVARARYGVGPMNGPPARVVLSDLLFYRSNGPSPNTAEEAAPLALSSERVRAGDKLGVFWEAYGTDPGGEKIKVSLIVARANPDDGGFLRRLVRIGQGRAPVSVSIEDLSARGSTISARGIELDISTLSRGAYIVQLEIEVAGQPALRSEHRIEVVSP
jgi:tetratricopeptide (TPR) repeat protein